MFSFKYSLKDFPAEELFELDQEDDPNALAKLILEKTGRKIPKTKKGFASCKALFEWRGACRSGDSGQACNGS